MRGVRDQFLLLGEFLRTDFRRTLLYTTLGLLLTLGVGAGLACLSPELVERMVLSFQAQIEAKGVVDQAGELSVFALLQNNWTAMLIPAVYGFIPFLFLPAVSLLANGTLMGMLGAWYPMHGVSLWIFLAGIAPHGICELPALVLSIACGLYLCRNMCRLVVGSEKRVPLVELLSDLLRVLVLLVMPLTVAAAFLECYVTPVFMDFVLR